MTQPVPKTSADQHPDRIQASVVADPVHRRRERTPLLLKLVRFFFAVFGRITPQLAARLGEWMFFRPWRHPMPEREAQWLEDAERVDETIDGMTLATYRWGTGPNVLLLHGWEGRGSQLGAFAEPLVAAGYRVVALDAPAHGHSSGHATNGFIYRDVVHELSRRLGGFRGVVAHSFGGTCTMLAMAQGMHVERAVLISPGVEGDTFFNGFKHIVGMPPRALAALKHRVVERFGAEAWSQLSSEKQGGALERGASASMVIHDVSDAEVDYSESVRLVESAPGTKFLSTEGLGHRRILRDDAIVNAVVDFIRN